MASSLRPPVVSKVGRLFAREVFPVVFSTGCKALFGMAFAAILLARLDPSASVAFFQLLLLQTIFVTFLSGAGYGRAVSASERKNGLVRLLRGYLLFAVLTTAAVALLEAFVVPRAIIDQFISPERWQIYALIAGGAATGLHVILQGALVRRWGAPRIFYPVSLVSVICALLLFFAPGLNQAELLAIYVGSQVATLIAFLAINPAALRLLGQSVSESGQPIDISDSWEALAFGAINALALVLYFLFRKFWSDRVDSSLAEAAFFAIRISEIVLGVLFVVVANSPLLRRFRYENPVRSRAIAGMGGGVILLTFALLLVTLAGSRLQGLIPLVVLCLGLQLLCEGLRVPGSMATLFELQYGTPQRFFLIAIPPYLAAAVGALAIAPVLPLFSFYFFQLIFPALQVAAALGSRAAFEARRRAD